MDPVQGKTHALRMDSDRPWTRLGKIIKDLRVKQQLSQSQLAELAGIDQRTISLIERGESPPTLPTLYKLSAALGLTLVEIARILSEEIDY